MSTVGVDTLEHTIATSDLQYHSTIKLPVIETISNLIGMVEIEDQTAGNGKVMEHKYC